MCLKTAFDYFDYFVCRYKRFNRTDTELKKIYSILENYNQVIIKHYAPNPNMPEPELPPIPEDVQKAFFKSFDLLKSCFERVGSFRSAFFHNLVYWAFESMQAAYNRRNTDMWPMLIQDEETLTKLYVAVYSKMSKIQLLLSKFFGMTRSIEGDGIIAMQYSTDHSIQHSHETIHTVLKKISKSYINLAENLRIFTTLTFDSEPQTRESKEFLFEAKFGYLTDESGDARASQPYFEYL